MYKIFFLILFCLSLTQAQAASFDCAKAGTPFEKTICSNPNLSSMDDRLAQMYFSAKATAANPEQFKLDQINWIKEARTCGTDVLCIELAYRKRMLALTPRPVMDSSTPQKTATDNFLIGLCISNAPKSDPLVTSCKIEDLRNRPAWTTGVQIYGASSMKSLLIFGQKSDPAYRKDNNTDVPITYELNGPNEITVTLNVYGGCMFVEKYTKNGNDIFAELLQIKGSCNDVQRRAGQEQQKDGKRRLVYIRAI